MNYYLESNLSSFHELLTSKPVQDKSSNMCCNQSIIDIDTYEYKEIYKNKSDKYIYLPMNQFSTQGVNEQVARGGTSDDDANFVKYQPFYGGDEFGFDRG